MTRWAILTGEYPPQAGGVADYTEQVARGLANAGDRVNVFAPPCALPDCNPLEGVSVHRLPDHFGVWGLNHLESMLSAGDRPDQILVQYVPQAFGYKAMNLRFARWIARRALHIAPVWVMFHEVMVPFRWWPMKNAILATAHKRMARRIAGAADRVLVSIPNWGERIRRISPDSKPAEWLPIPSNIPIADLSQADPKLDGRSPRTVGHFGTYGEFITGLLDPTLRILLKVPGREALLLGRGGQAFRARMIAVSPQLADRLHAPGELPAADLARQLRSCHLLLQPYVDGISSRRTSVMAGLANSVPLVSNLGELSEPLWANSQGIRLAPSPDPAALSEAAEAVLAMSGADRAEMGRQAASLYRERFSLEHTIARLRNLP